MNIYDFTARSIEGRPVSLSNYRGKVLLVVNTASACGFTPQYQGLEELYRDLGPKGLTVLGFPCNQFGEQEQASEPEIAKFCERNYGVTFPLFSKIEVNGPNADPIFEYLKRARRGILFTSRIKWNFTKFLVDREGAVVKRYAPRTKPAEIRPGIERLLNR